MFVQSSLGSSAIPVISSSQDVSHSKQNLQKEAFADLVWKQQDLTLTFRQWIQKANEMNIDVNKQINKMASVIHDQPAIKNDYQLVVWLLYETTMLNIFSSQIIRKMAKERIKRAAASARAMPGLQHQLGLINQTEQYLLRRLPAKLPSRAPVEMVAEQYWGIEREVERVMEQIHSKAKHVQSNPLKRFAER